MPRQEMPASRGKGTRLAIDELLEFAAPQRERKMKNIFVGNLNFRTTEDEIRTLFAAYGNVDRVSLITDRDTGQPRGFGFVEMSNDAEAERAIAELNGREVGGRAINVNEARPKEGGPRRGGGFRR